MNKKLKNVNQSIWYTQVVLIVLLSLMVLVATIDFWLSFNALSELASYGKWDVNQSRAFAVSIDSVLLIGTIGIFASEMFSWQNRTKKYMWLLLGIASVLTLVGNSLTPYLTSKLLDFNTILSMSLHAVVPLFYIMLTEGLRLIFSEVFQDNVESVKAEQKEVKKLTANLTPQEKRKQHIVNLVKTGNELVYVDLATQLNTTRQTIAKDVNTLETEGIINKNGDGKYHVVV